MSHGVYSKLLAVGTAVASPVEVVYTCPPGHTAILKLMTLRASSAGQADLRVLLEIGSGARTGFFTKIIPANTTEHVETWCVIPEGWTIAFQNVSTSAGYYWLSGTELAGVPPTPTVPTRVGGVVTPLPSGELP